MKSAPEDSSIGGGKLMTQLNKLVLDRVYQIRAMLRQKAGNVAMIAALSLLPIITLLGMTVDYRFADNARLKAQVALDQAILMAARERQDGKSKAEVEAAMQSVFNTVYATAGKPAQCESPTLKYYDGTYEMTATVSCFQPTTISAAIGRDTIPFTTTSSSTYGIGKLDVVFVFDSSGSMSGSKLTSLKAAARDAVDTILPQSLVADGNIRIAMVTYNQMVNAGPYFDDVVEKTTYTDGSGGTPKFSWTQIPGQTCTTHYFWGMVYYMCAPGPVERPLNTTCVYERGGDEAFTAAAPDTDAWLQPGGVNENSCPPTTPLPLTNNRFNLHAYVDSLTADGGTAGHQGVAWGWYLIDPDWDDVWPTLSEPLPYNEPDSTKVIILMTDGEFNSAYFNGQGSSDAQARSICNEMHSNEKIVVYSVAFQAPQSGQDVLEYCATETENFFAASTAQELEDAYQSIATSVSDLRISR